MMDKSIDPRGDTLAKGCFVNLRDALKAVGVAHLRRVAKVETQGIEPWALTMQMSRAAPALCPQPIGSPTARTPAYSINYNSIIFINKRLQIKKSSTCTKSSSILFAIIAMPIISLKNGSDSMNIGYYWRFPFWIVLSGAFACRNCFFLSDMLP